MSLHTAITPDHAPERDPGADPTPAHRSRRTTRGRGDRGEGVISTAIAVLVMTFLGAGMWVAFNSLWSDTATTTENQVRIIGSDTAVAP